jgi:DNA topoisomerase I
MNALPIPASSHQSTGSTTPAAGSRLRRSNLADSGIVRRRSGTGFSYWHPDGTLVSGVDRERIRQLAVPPGWNEVWICPFGNGHIQATGIDELGRVQYLYHPRWRAKQDAEKFKRAAQLGTLLPRIRRTVSRHLRESASPRDRALAAAVRLLDLGALRVGGESYARQYGSYGLTTLRCRHASVVGDTLTLKFPGKSGQRWESTIQDPVLAGFVAPLLERPGKEPLLAFFDAGTWTRVDAGMVNRYLKDASGGPYTAKDLRTWTGTVTVALALAGTGEEVPVRKAVAQAVACAAERLGNTPAVVREAYVDPRVVDAYLDGSLRHVGASETAIARFLTEPA